MGNDHSQLSGIDIEEKVVEVSDFWSQHHAYIDNSSRISIFIGDLFINEPLWNPSTPLEKFSKNLMLYRHPCIIKYISSWQKTSKFYLAVEDITPLGHILAKMSVMEICLGLYSILKALCFLHEKAGVSHNNVCSSAIFVSKEGNWKLGGMEYLCRYKDLTIEFLIKSKNYRYSKAVDSNEEKYLKDTSRNKDFIDVYAFGVLVNDVLKNKNDSDMCNISSFKDYCKDIVQCGEISQRPNLKSLLEHEIFKQKFINIHSFLIELPLKSEAEKSEFFLTLKTELEAFDENIVASQLGGVLVSRMVMINKTAREHFLPMFLSPRGDNNDGLFTIETFREHISPKLLKIFGVRDAQIRLVLLKHFSQFINCFTKQELQQIILPELLLGIKDTNNYLIAATLHILAELVPVLGAEIVIGGKRANLFKDNSPKSHSHNVSRKMSKNEIETISNNIDQVSLTSSMAELIQNQIELPEIPRPDGEEGDTSTEEIEQSIDDENDHWEDWDNVKANTDSNEVVLHELLPATKVVENVLKSAKKIVDITELDIKNQTQQIGEESEVDFFQDMEPVIETSKKFSLENIKEEKNQEINSKLLVKAHDIDDDGWGDDWD